MISQADIIKTLMNKNCTDESVMTTALTPGCTLAKILVKLTETEHFDLALDVSMKSGQDVIPLWRTWAMRCLKNRNFQGAREKFRHCFPRKRSLGYRLSSTQNKLLTDILDELSSMEETRLPFSEEIERIKHLFEANGGEIVSENDQDEQRPSTLITSRPKIYAECTYYLQEYGNTEDRVKFYIKYSLWEQAVRILLESSSRIRMEKFFQGDVIPYILSRGHLSHLVATFLKLDPSLRSSECYYESIYKFCVHNLRYNLLYYIQSTIGDNLAAANTQLNHFFLANLWLEDYRELNHRLPSLMKAREDYEKYLAEMKTDESSYPKLFSVMTRSEVEKMLELVDMQIDITRNFAVNEVSGRMNGGEVLDSGASDNDGLDNSHCDGIESPVTLFDTSETRKTFLAALVLIYFDLSCSTYFSKNGLDLANRIIDDHGLDKPKVFKTAMRIIIEDESCDILTDAGRLLDRLREDFMADRRRLAVNSRSGDRRCPPGEGAKQLCDEVIRDSIGSCRDSDYKMELAKLLSSEAKIELYIELGKLSNAQNLAFQMNRPDYVLRIVEAAARLNQNHVKTVCQLWLAKHETKSPTR